MSFLFKSAKYRITLEPEMIKVLNYLYHILLHVEPQIFPVDVWVFVNMMEQFNSKRFNIPKRQNWTITRSQLEALRNFMLNYAVALASSVDRHDEFTITFNAINDILNREFHRLAIKETGKKYHESNRDH